MKRSHKKNRIEREADRYEIGIHRKGERTFVLVGVLALFPFIAACFIGRPGVGAFVLCAIAVGFFWKAWVHYLKRRHLEGRPISFTE